MATRLNDPPFRPIGTGHVGGMARQGLRELRAALYPESNVAQPPDLGIAGNATPGEVEQARRPNEQSKEIANWEQEGGSICNSYVQKAQQAQPPKGRDDREMERE